MTIDEILPQLLVGCCLQDRADIDFLKANHGITAVLSLQTDDDFVSWGIDWQEMEATYRATGVELRRVPIEDFNPEDLRRKLPDCVDALDELLRTGHKVYIHCTGGINRSPSTVVA